MLTIIKTLNSLIYLLMCFVNYLSLFEKDLEKVIVVMVVAVIVIVVNVVTVLIDVEVEEIPEIVEGVDDINKAAVFVYHKINL